MNFFSLAYNANEHGNYFAQFYVYVNVELCVVNCSIARARSLNAGKNYSGEIRVKGESSERCLEV